MILLRELGGSLFDVLTSISFECLDSTNSADDFIERDRIKADTIRGLGPEIAMFRLPQEGSDEDWYIKPSK